MNTPLKLKIALQDLPHKCERTLLVPENITMRQLHFVIQEAFGWFNAHFFEFSDTKGQAAIKVGIPNDFGPDFGDTDTLEAHKVNLKDTFMFENGAKPFWYTYDFGDDWQHRISFLKTSQKEAALFKGSPVCLKALGKCPPEDCGGAWGYADFLETIKDNKHPEHNELREWYGLENNEVYDENEVNLEMTNRLLEEFYTSAEWKSESYGLF